MDILEYAIKMENDGEKFYLELAEQNKDTKLNNVFRSLANDEAHHAKIIRDKRQGIATSFSEETETAAKNVFSDDEFMIESDVPGQVDAYKGALEKEQESIDLYKKLKSEAEGDEELFSFLIEQEEGHYKLIEEIIEMVNRPNEWVESAEFGRRKEY